MSKYILSQFAKHRILLITAAACLAFGIVLEKKLNLGKVAAQADACTTADCEMPHDAHAESETAHDEPGHTEAAHAEEIMITLRDSAIRQFGIELAQAGPGKIGMHTTLPAEVALNDDNKAHVVPRIPGVVRSVMKTLGDNVRAGEVLAVIHSRELADFKAAYLAAREKIGLAEAMFEREKSLWEKKITAEQDYLKAKSDLADARIELRSAEQKLHALGLSEDYLGNLPSASEESYIVYEITAPIDGTIIERHITTGEVLRDDSETFIVADLRNVWVNVNISQKDLPNVKRGQKALLKTDHTQGQGIVSYVSGVVNENTRTALARIVLPNDLGQWRPGTFATANIYVEEFDCPIVIPNDAVVTMENESFVFVASENGFVPREVVPGRVNSEFVEIASGLEAGERYVTKGAFTLKSELMKSNQDPCGGH